MDIHMAEPLVPQPSLVELEVATGKFRRYKSLGTEQFMAKLIKVGGEHYVLDTQSYSFYIE
jgi:hypothetical protein